LSVMTLRKTTLCPLLMFVNQLSDTMILTDALAIGAPSESTTQAEGLPMPIPPPESETILFAQERRLREKQIVLKKKACLRKRRISIQLSLFSYG
jgi:hypothetical protein